VDRLGAPAVPPGCEVPRRPGSTSGSEGLTALARGPVRASPWEAIAPPRWISAGAPETGGGSAQGASRRRGPDHHPGPGLGVSDLDGCAVGEQSDEMRR
jgi:hypothetical protein